MPSSRLTRLSLAVPALWLLLNSVIVAVTFYAWREATNDVRSITAHSLENTQQMLDDTLSFASGELVRLQQNIRMANGDLKAIQPLLAQQSNRGYANVRFAWIDQHGQLRAGSATGILATPYDVSDRPYIEQTRKKPFVPIISTILIHRITHKPIIVVSMGITSFQNIHLGTLNAIMHLDVLGEAIKARLAVCQCEYRVLSPHHETLLASEHYRDRRNQPSASHMKESAFTVEGYTASSILHAITRTTFTAGFLTCMLFNAVCLIFWRLLHRRVFDPLSRHLSAAAAIRAEDGTIHTIEQQINHIGALGLSYAALSQQLRDTKLSLSEARQTLSTISLEQSRLSFAAGNEMQRSFSAIQSYATLLEDMIALQLLDPDHRYHYDDVVEMGENLMRLSQAMHVLNKPESTTSSLLSIATLCENTLDVFAPNAERRNISIQSHRGSMPLVRLDEEVATLLLSCMMFEWIRCAQDEAALSVESTTSNGHLRLCFHATRARTRLLPPSKQDFGSFLPSMQRNNQAAITAYMVSQANCIVAEALAKRMGGAFSVSAYQADGYSLSLILPL